MAVENRLPGVPTPPPPAAPPTPRRRDGRERLLTGPFVAVFAANLLVGMSFFLFVHLPRYLEVLGADEVVIGVVVATTAVVAVVTRPAIGTALDRRGRRRVAVAGAVVNLLAVLAYLTVDVVGPWLYVVRCVHGLGEAATFTAFFTVGADIVPASRRTEGLALFGVSGLLPLALGGLVGDVALGIGGFDALVVTSAVFGVGALLLALVLPRTSTPDPTARTTAAGFLGVVRNPRLRAVWGLTLAFAFSLATYFVFIAVYVDTVGFGSVGAFFGAYVATAVLLRLGFAWLPQRLGERRVLLPCCLAMAAGLAVLAGASSSRDVVVAGVLCGLGHGYVFPILFGIVVTRADPARRGSAMAMFSALFDVGTLVGGPVLGAVVAGFGYGPMFAAAAGLLVVATAAYAVVDRPGRVAAT